MKEDILVININAQVRLKNIKENILKCKRNLILVKF